MIRACAVIFLLTALLPIGCGKKPAPPPSPSGVILAFGKGAVLVHFGAKENLRREDWLAQIHLQGAHDTHSLPRIPLADLKSLLVLDVEPGVYRVIAQAWVRKHTPTTGGTLDSVRVSSGQVTVLRAQPLSDEFSAEPEVPLLPIGRQTWTLRTEGELPSYVSEVLQQTVKG